MVSLSNYYQKQTIYRTVLPDRMRHVQDLYLLLCNEISCTDTRDEQVCKGNSAIHNDFQKKIVLKSGRRGRRQKKFLFSSLFNTAWKFLRFYPGLCMSSGQYNCTIFGVQYYSAKECSTNSLCCYFKHWHLHSQELWNSDVYFIVLTLYNFDTFKW